MKKKTIALLLTMVLLLAALSPAALAWSDEEMTAAETLNSLGVFRGTGSGFALDQTMTRQEAAILLVRLLGRENIASSGQWATSFTDVSGWAAVYVAYADCAGLVNGYDRQHFGGTDAVTGGQFVCLLLRALGYRDGTDFVWSSPWALAGQLGLTDAGETYADGFTRGDAALLCARALDKTIRGTRLTLRSQLDEQKVSGVLSSTQIADRCNQAVFRLTAYRDKDCQIPVGNGSGFFITADGIAVTNYHVVENGVTAQAVTLSGDTYNVEGIITADQKNDLAIFRVSRTSVAGNTVSSFPVLTLGYSSTMRVGSTVYSIGCPLGYSNTVASGIIGSMSRDYDDVTYIQFSAPISSGSSGGPVINEQGRVIAVTTATFTSGQNMNLAMPIDLVRAMDWTGDALPIDEYFEMHPKILVDDEDCVITADTERLDLTVGQARRVLISTDCDSEFYFHYNCSDEDVLKVEWGNWVGSRSAYLYITALKPGIASVEIDFMDGTGNPDASIKIFVTVSAAETNTGAPDDSPSGG